MKKRLLLAFFVLLLTFFSIFFGCNPAFQLTEAQKEWFDNLEKEWIEPFKKLANLDDQEMKLVLDTIGEMKKQRSDYLFKAEKVEYFHDKNIPKEVMQRTYKVLEKHGINPYRIDIKTKIEEKDLIAEATDHVTIKRFFNIQNETTVFDFQYHSNPTLWLHESSYTLSYDFFENTILHELGHLGEAHSGQRALLRIVLEGKKVPKKEIKSFFKRLIYAIEFIADQRLTINNRRNIENMIKEYSESKENKKTIEGLLSTSSVDDLKITYDERKYPSYIARWLSLTMMKKILYKEA